MREELKVLLCMGLFLKNSESLLAGGQTGAGAGADEPNRFSDGRGRAERLELPAASEVRSFVEALARNKGEGSWLHHPRS
jgi:hypothetical protein